MKHRFLVLLIMTLVFAQSSLAQSVLKGKVVDENDGSPLIGATVVVQGTSQGTATNLDGTFTLQAAARDVTIKVSYVGYIAKTFDYNLSQGQEKDMGTVALKSSSIGLDEVKVVANFAKDRETPVAVSKVQPIQIEEKLGTQELPELMKSTPSVYATKQGGGFGDSRINIRGFSQQNIAVLINGVPVNDMEGGEVYWSNWANLADVTKTIQVQRGLGASKLAISSVGGTMNIITNSTDAERGGTVYQSIGNDAFTKTSFSLSTGLMDNGWAVTLQGSKSSGNGFVNATNFESYSYFFNISKRINENHRLSLTGFGAPQWHNQRSSPHQINDYRNHEEGIKYNSDYGYLNGEIYPTAYAYNEYHKPQFYLNHYWKINKNTSLHTSTYASIGRGGGRRADGPKDQWIERDYPSGDPYEITQLTPQGFIDYDYVLDQNASSQTGSQAIMTMAKNEHDWYGVLSTFNTKYANINITAGFDGRYYKGYHYTEISNLLGGDYYLDDSNINRDPTKPLMEGAKINYYNLGEVLREGVFLQGEYVTANYSAFLSSTVSNKSYRRVDYFQYEPGNQKTSWENFLVYSVKGGFNYNINKNHNVFVNGGYFTRAPFFTTIFKNYTNEINKDAKLQKILSTEAGYGYRSSKLKLDLTGFRTVWMDKTLTRTIGDEFANITGLNAIHMGVELESTYKPTQKLSINGMFSMGDYRWDKNVIADVFNERQEYVGTVSVFAKDIKRGNTALTTGYLGASYMVLPDLKIGADMYHAADIFAEFDIENRTTEASEGVESWKMPNYTLVNANVRWDFDLAGFDATLYGNVDNLLDTEYISDAKDGVNHTAQNASVWYGWGRTWNLGVKFRF